MTVLDWLLDSDPAIRWQVLRDLVHAPAEVVVAERVRVMLSRPEKARIINISSIVASRGYTGLAAYSASKAGMDGLTRSLAREVGRRGITVNSVAPGYLDTALSASLTEPQRRQIINRTPLGRLGNVDDVVPVISFLLSEAADFITARRSLWMAALVAEI